ncbi:MAG: hypothetical protein WCG23_03920 [bacterium]
MKKYLAILGLLLAVSQPVFAQCSSCNTCLPRVQAVAVPIAEPCNTCSPYMTGAAVPIAPVVISNPYNTCNTCNPCQTGAAVPIVTYGAYNPCNQCCQDRKGFWKRFLGY